MIRHCLCVIALTLAACSAGPSRLPVPPLPESVRVEPGDFVLVLVQNLPAHHSTRAGSTMRGYDGAAAYGVSSAAAAVARALAADYSLEEVSAWPISALRAHCVMYRVPSGQTPASLVERLATDRRVQLAQPLQHFTTSGAVYDDPYLGLQRGFARMSIAAAHQWSLGEGVTVAVIDTGVDTSHPDLDGRTRVARNYVGDRASASVAERHGTAIAGIIAAVGNNGQGIVGVAPRVSLLSLRACWSADTAAAVGTCNTFTLARAMSAAIEAGADIINLSLVGPSDPLLAALVKHALEGGTIVVGAVPAGGRVRGFPSEVAGVLPVDMAEQDRPAPSALRAPGREVLTLAPQGHYDFVTGSSFATASVSGAVALMRARRPRLTSDDVRALLQRSMQASLGSVDSIEAIDACSALSALLTTGRCPPLAATGTAGLHSPDRSAHVRR